MSATNVQLKVNGMIYAGWEEVSVRQSIRAVSGSFNISLTDQWDVNSQPWPLVPGDECKLLIAGQTVIVGFVDDVDTDVDANAKKIRVAGRDYTADIVDCSAVYPTGSFNTPMGLLQLAKVLCKPYTVNVSSNVDLSTPLASNPAVNEGETVFQVLDRGAKECGVLMISDGAGGILFTRSGQKSAGYALQQGVNLKSFGSRYTQKERYSSYVVKPQMSFDHASPGGSPSITGTATDSQIARFRRLTIAVDPENMQISATSRAQWEASTRAGKSQPVYGTIVGFTKPNGDLWAVNELVPVKIPLLRINQELLIEGLTFSYGPSGSLTSFELVRPDAYLLQPLNNKQDLLRPLVLKESGNFS